MNNKQLNNGTSDLATMALYEGHRLDFKKYRSAALLPEEYWKYMDETVTAVGHEELVGIQDLKDAPGVVKVIDGMTADVYTERRASGVNNAIVRTTPDNRGEVQKQDYDTHGVPLPVTFQEYEMDVKKARMAARGGLPIETNLLEECVVSVAQTLEQTLFNGTDFEGNILKWHGYQLYGYTNFPDRNQYTIPVSWATANPKAIVDDVILMMKASRQAKHYGGWTLYIPWQYQERLDEDYLTGVGNDYPISGSIENRLMQLKGLEAIKVSDFLADDNIILAELKPRSIRLIEGLPIRVIAWDGDNAPYWRHLFKVIAMTVPFLKADYNGNSGIVHGHL
jgi:hypothetical protein